MNIVGIGECMIEMRKVGNTYAMGVGGDVFNALAMASHLGTPTQFLTAFGNDLFASNIESMMQKYKVDLSLAKKKSGFTGLYFIETDPAGERSFQYYRKGSAPSLFIKTDLPLPALAAETKLVFASGISQAVSPTMAESVYELFQWARQKSVITAFDVNYRDRLWTPQQASMPLSQLYPLIDVIFTSHDDKAVMDLLPPFKNGPSLIVERMGSLGARAMWQGETWEEPAPPTAKVVDTTAAGDIFAGTFLHFYLNQKPIKDCLKAAVTAGSAHVQTPGALVQLPSL